jgi:hypothetical protein
MACINKLNRFDTNQKRNVVFLQKSATFVNLKRRFQIELEPRLCEIRIEGPGARRMILFRAFLVLFLL